MMPKNKLKLLISLSLLVFSGREMFSQNALAAVYRTLYLNQPELFDVSSGTLNNDKSDKETAHISHEEKTDEVKDPYKRTRLSLNMSVAASSIYQGAILSRIFSVKETLGAPPFTFDIYTRTAFGKAFPYLFIGAMSIGSIMKNSGQPVQPGLSGMYMYGSFIGLFHGTVIATSFADTNTSNYNRSIAFLSGSMSLAEGMWLTHFAKKNKLTSQETNFAISSNFYGGIVGAGLGGIVSNFENQFKILSLGFLAGSIGGTYFSKYMIRNRSITNGDLTFMNASSALGLFIGMSIHAHSENRLTTSLGYITSVGATFAGSYFLTKYYPFTTNDGFKITVGAGVGFLTGMGFSLAIQSKTFHSALFSMVSGAILGFAGTTYKIMKSNHIGDQLIYHKKKNKCQLRYNFNPNGLVLNLRNQDAQLKMMQSGMNVDLLQLHYRF